MSRIQHAAERSSQDVFFTAMNNEGRSTITSSGSSIQTTRLDAASTPGTNLDLLDDEQPYEKEKEQVGVGDHTSIATTLDESQARSVFGTKEYWDDVYLGRGDFPAEQYSWYYGWDDGLGKHVREFLPLPSSPRRTSNNNNNNTKSSSGSTTSATPAIPPPPLRILIPGIGNDSILLNLYNAGYTNLVAQDYSQHAVERQLDLLTLHGLNNYVHNGNDDDNDDSSSDGSSSSTTIQIVQGDVTCLPTHWTSTIDAVIEKGLLDAVYLSGGDNVVAAVANLRRVLKPNTGLLFSISGVVPDELRLDMLFPKSCSNSSNRNSSCEKGAGWEWLRDGASDLQAGCFVLRKKS
jgi:hypothetical protein